MTDNQANKIIEDICDKYGVDKEDLISNARGAYIVQARKECVKNMVKAKMTDTAIMYFLKLHNSSLKNFKL